MVVMYFATSSVAWFATAPTTDKKFGRLNHCLMALVPQGRVGFAISPDGNAAATFGGAGVAWCVHSGQSAKGRYRPLAGITRITFDGDGNLWVATGQGADAALWRIPPEESPIRVSDDAPQAMAGHRSGIVVLDSNGRLVSISSSGDARAFADPPRVPEPRLIVDGDGSVVALVGGGAWWVYRAEDLQPMMKEAPCKIDFVWWLSTPGEALVSCAPDGSLSLRINARTGAREEVARHERKRSVLVPGLRVHAVACDGLPCEAPAP
jgi:hypothetical protein